MNNPKVDILVRNHQELVFHTCYGILKNHEDAADASQETWLKVLQNFSYYDEQRGPVEMWLKGIARRVCIDQIRLREKSHMSLDALSENDKDEISDHDLYSEDPYIQVDLLRSQLRKVMKMLTHRERAVARLFYWGELSLGETADDLGIAVNTVKNHLANIRHKLERLEYD